MPSKDTSAYHRKGTIGRSKKECDGRSYGIAAAAKEPMEFTMQENDTIIPEPKKGQGLQHVSVFIDELLGEVGN